MVCMEFKRAGRSEAQTGHVLQPMYYWSDNKQEGLERSENLGEKSGCSKYTDMTAYHNTAFVASLQ